MGNKYFRSLVDTSSSGTNSRMGTFVGIDERVIVDLDFDKDTMGRVYRSVDGELCWLYFKAVREETSQEAIEELLLGNW